MKLFFTGILLLLLGACSNNESDISGTPGVDETSNGLALVVRDAGGNPIQGARVSVRPADWSPGLQEPALGQVPGDTAGLVVFDGYTDSAGLCLVPRLKPGMYNVESNFKDFGAIRAWESPQELQTPDTLILEMDTLSFVIGKADLPPGYSSGVVQVIGTVHWTYTEEDGSYILRGVPAGDVILQVILPAEEKVISAAQKELAPGDTLLTETTDFIPIEDQSEQWTDSLQVIFHGGASGAGLNETVYDFPLLMRLQGAHFPRNAGHLGSGLRVFDAEDEPVPFEIALWDELEQKAQIWVKMDSLLGKDSVEILKILWGETAAWSKSNGPAVFDTADGWQGAWHMVSAYRDPENRLRTPDATANQESGIGAGISGNGPSFLADGMVLDGSGQTLSIGGASTEWGGDTISIGLWIKTSRQGCIFLEKGDTLTHWDHREKIFYLGETGGVLADRGWVPTFLGHGEPNAYFHARDSVLPTEWHFLVFQRYLNSAQLRWADWYQQGHLVSTEYNVFPLEKDAPQDSIIVGRIPDNERAFSGMMRYLHISGKKWSPEWIRLSYETQKPYASVVQFE